MRIFVFAATYVLRVSRKSHLRDHPRLPASGSIICSDLDPAPDPALFFSDQDADKK